MTETHFSEGFLDANGITQHYIQYQNDNPKIFLLHGLTANANAFDGVANNLKGQYHLIAPDLRGRGLSSHPAFCYSLNEHAEDVLALFDYFQIDKAVVAGHSFGGLLAFYLAANYPERIKCVIALDAAAKMNSRAGEMLSYSLLRLDTVYPSFKSYLNLVKQAPYNTFWESAMLSYYRADVRDLPSGGVTSRSRLANIIEIATNVANEPWLAYIENIFQPVLLLNALDDYTMGEPLLPEAQARDTVERLARGQYGTVNGNHQTMIYGEGAKDIAKEMKKFILGL